LTQIKGTRLSRYYGPNMRTKSIHSQAREYLSKLESVLIGSKPDSYKVNVGTDGVIYIGGGRYWPGIVVGCKMLRKLGYEGQIEIWYRGKVESVYSYDLSDLNVRMYDISTFQDSFDDFRLDLSTYQHGGWCAKLYALMHTGLERVLYLDADAYCVENPQKLFDLLYGYSFVFWKDLPSQANSIKWQNVYPNGFVSDVPQIQGGQLLINRTNAKQIIQIANYLCEHADYYFQHMYGDQDTWRVALSFLQSKDYYCIGKANWQNVAFNCMYEGKSYVIHRCRGKLFDQKDIPAGKTNYSNPHYNLPRESEVFDLFAECLNNREREASQVFNNIYTKKLWGKQPSGSGSTIKEALPYIDYVNDLIRSKGYETVVDAGCGDLAIAGKLECKQYFGYDCVDNIRDLRNVRFSSIFNTFSLDIYKNYGIMKMGDVLLCKDVLHHWPNEWVENWLERLIESKKWKAIVLCNDRLQLYEGQNCHLGGYRALSHLMFPLKGFPFKLAKEFLHKEILIWEG
jgi:hypothetical protein